ncbi:noroxomaritidine synthase 3-like [Typha latifolia]|uniref:noroxomaritidine synthase 3-like n=1 Tax=Typha latifolia TaxID=4733 RepID=UPI003C2D5786
MGSIGCSWLLSLQTLFYSYPETLLALLSFLTFSLLRRRHTILPTNWPVVGMLPTLVSEFPRLHDYVTDVLRLSGCTLLFRGPWLLRMDFLLTCDPSNVNHVFNLHPDNYPKGHEFADIFDVLGDSILIADSDSWRFQRRLAHSVLGDRLFRSFVANTGLAKVRNGLIPFLDHMAANGHVVDLEDVFSRYSFDTACTTVLGVDFLALSVEFPTIPFAEAIHEAEAALHLRHTMPSVCWKLLRWLNIGRERKLAMARVVIDKFIFQEVYKRKKQRQDLSAADMLTVYMNWRSDSDDMRKCNYDQFLRDTTLSFMIAGKETVATSLVWFFYMVCVNPNVEAKIVEELRALPSEKAGPYVVFDADVLRRSVYLHAAFLETLRLFPPVPFEEKEAANADVLPCGAKVSKGMRIIFSLYAMGRMEGVWGKDCMQFRPERWISKGGRVRHEPSYKFLTFNSGPRSCLGKDLALTQLKMVAAAMIYNFHVELAEGHAVVPANSIVLQLQNGLMGAVKRRSTI